MKKALLLACALMLTTNANASELTEFLIQENITLTNVKERATLDAKPDMFRSTIEFTAKSYSAEDAQQELNRKIKSATKIVKDYNFEYELSSFNIYQDYKSKKQFASQSITLESKNKEKIEKLTTQLQNNEGLVKSTTSYLSEEMKKQEFEKLFETAYTKATDKAKFITKQMNAANFKVTNANYYMNERSVRPMAFRGKAMMAESTMSDANIEIDNSDKEIWLELTLEIAVEKSN